MKEYDFTSLNDFFNEFMPPKELADQLVQILFNYMLHVSMKKHLNASRMMQTQ